MLQKVLENLGWSDKEAAVYLAILGHGSLIISDISKYSKINRVTVYDTIEKLMQKGAISKTIRNNRKYYTASGPELLYQVEQEKVDDFSKHLQEFKDLAAKTSRKHVRFFEGSQGTNLLYNDMHNDKNHLIKCFLAPQNIYAEMPDVINQFIQKRISENGVVHAIMPDLPTTQFYIDNQDAQKRVVKLVPNKKFNFKTSFYYTNSKFYIIDFENKISGILIEDKQIAESLEAIFDMCWELL